jgi:hypothetical protein
MLLLYERQNKLSKKRVEKYTIHIESGTSEFLYKGKSTKYEVAESELIPQQQKMSLNNY